MNHAIEELQKVRQKLVDAKTKAVEKYDFEISEVDRAIKLLEGKDPKDTSETFRYDDENPDYIKGSIEEL